MLPAEPSRDDGRVVATLLCPKTGFEGGHGGCCSWARAGLAMVMMAARIL